METILFGVFLAIALLIYGYCSNNHNNEDVVLAVEAGPMSDAEPSVLVHTKSASKILRLANGNYINTSDGIRIRINGHCMEKKNINNHEEWLAMPVKHKKSISSQIKAGDVLLIYVPDKNMYKVRELSNILGNGFLETFYYLEDGSKHISTQNHQWNMVKGVVRYAI